MSTKKKPANQPNRLVPPETKVEEYKPSDNLEKYPDLQKPLYKYRILTVRNDWTRLQEDVTNLLNDGWQLAGGVSSSMYTTPYETTTVFSQAVYKI
jgi:hypothetical protein